ncbi:hypothetical protein UT300007_20550 [Clostridium sp. CTA-7]
MRSVLAIIEEATDCNLNGIDYELITPDNISKWDSLVHINLIMLIEEEFDIEVIPDEMNEMFKGYNNIVNVLNKKGVILE